MGQHSAEMQCNEPICFSPYLYRARNLVERFFNRIKQCGRIAATTRGELPGLCSARINTAVASALV